MKRFHLFEFEDQSWFPANIRNYGTDFLQFVANHQMDLYQGILPILEKGLSKVPNKTIIDLASGGGGPWLKVKENLEKNATDFKVIFTDYFPNVDAFERMTNKGDGKFSYRKESVNALDVPEDLKGLRTQFLSFHHFRPEQAQQILQNAVDHQSPICIFEAQERTFATLIQFALSPINVLLSTPFIRPFKLGRLLFTYLIPIVPLFVLWDGIVSVLRTYTVEEMEAMTQRLTHTDSFNWEIGKVKTGPVTNLYLLGYPTKKKINT